MLRMKPGRRRLLGLLLAGVAVASTPAPPAEAGAALRMAIARKNPPLRAIATRGVWPHEARSQATTEAKRRRISRMRHYMGSVAATEMRIVLCGKYNDSTSNETNIGSATTVEAFVEFTVGAVNVTVQLTWEGGLSVGTVPDGLARYVSDPIYPGQFGLSVFPPNVAFWIRRSCTVPLNAYHQVWQTKQSPAVTGEDCIEGDPATFTTAQLSGTGALSATGGATLSVEHPVQAIIGKTIAPAASMAITGDSIITANADNVGDGSNSNGGFCKRALFDVGGTSVKWAWIGLSVPGSRATNWATSSSGRAEYLQYCTFAICNFGTNDIAAGRTLTQLQTDLRFLWAQCRANGIQHITEVPVAVRASSSSDSYTTPGGQTIAATFQASGLRGQINSSNLTDQAAGLFDAVFDINLYWEDQSNPDKWVTTGVAFFPTSDGTHPKAGTSALAAAPLKTYLAALPRPAW